MGTPNPLPCGCRAFSGFIRGADGDMHNAFHVIHCPLHDAAADLLAALKEIRDNCGCCEDVEPCANCNRAAAAIAKAEPPAADTRS